MTEHFGSAHDFDLGIFDQDYGNENLNIGVEEMDIQDLAEQGSKVAMEMIGLNQIQANCLHALGEGIFEEFIEDPYSFIGRIPKFTIEQADRIRKKINPDEEDLAYSGQLPARDEGLVLNILSNISNPAKETYVSRRTLEGRLESSGLTLDRMSAALSGLEEKGRIAIHNFGLEDWIYLGENDRDEEIVAEKIAAMLKVESPYSQEELELRVKQAGNLLNFKLNQDQEDAIRTVLQNRISIITGGPGTGKTSIIEAVYGALLDAGEMPEICAFTGRAAKRIKEATGLSAKTIHRLLEASLDAETKMTVFSRHRDNPLEVGAIIIDEASMVGLDIFARLLDAIPATTRLIIVGDEKQLPPVNSGCVLKELIDSGLIPMTKLYRVHRQAEGSEILDFAHRIRQLRDDDSGRGLAEEMADNYGSQLVFQERIKNAEVVADVMTIMADILTDEPLSSTDEFLMSSQIIMPLKKETPSDGGLNTSQINKLIQYSLNPPSDKPERYVRSTDTVFRLDDKVIHTKNNYSLAIYDEDGIEIDSGVFNGEVGRIVDITEDGDVVVSYGQDRRVIYEPDNLEELELAYALTVHKAQGSEIDKVIFALPTKITRNNRPLMKRNLFYTALTRARKKVWVIGSRASVASAIKMTERPWKSGISARIKENLSLD